MAKHTAVVVGINYTHFPPGVPTEVSSRAGLNRLRYAEDDARALSEALKAANYNVLLLVGMAATRVAIIDAIVHQSEAVESSGVFLVYFAGHGDVDRRGRAYLLPADADPARLAAQGLAMEDLAEHYLYDVSASVVLLDCCHSGYVEGPHGWEDAETREFLYKTREAFLLGRRRVALAACASNQQAREISSLQHGAFTYYVLEHWYKNHGEIDADLLYREITLGLQSLHLPPPVRGGVQEGRIVLRSTQIQSTPPPSLTSEADRRRALYNALIGLDDAHWKLLLAELSTVPPLGKSRPVQIRSLINEWDSEVLSKVLEEAQTLATRQNMEERQQELANLWPQFTTAVSKKEWDTAIERGERILTLDPIHQEARSRTAFVYLRRGNTYYDQGRYVEALSDLTRALELDPHNAIAYNDRGNTYYEQQRYDEALADFTRALELDQQNAYTYFNRGNTYYDLGRYHEALADFTRTLKLDPQNAHAYNNRGNLHQVQGRYAEALADYNRALDLNPQFAEAYTGRGRVHHDQKRYAEALADYDRALDLNPQFALAYVGRGNVYYTQKQYNRAITEYTRAIEIEPKNAIVYSNRSNAYRKMGRKKEADADQRLASELNPSRFSAP